MKFLIFVGMNVGAAIGWSAAERWGIMAAFLVSSLGSILGIYAGWWTARRWL